MSPVTSFVRWVRSQEVPLSTFAILLGFLLDYITLIQTTRLFDHIVLIGYFVLGVAAVTYTYWFDSYAHVLYKRPSLFRRFRTLRAFVPFIAYFCIGALFSGFVVFYSRGTSAATNWPYLLVFLGIMGSTAFLYRLRYRLIFQVVALAFALYSYATFTIPILVRTQEWWVFLLSTAASLAVVLFLLQIAGAFIPRGLTRVQQIIVATVLVVYGGSFLFHITNTLPPVPFFLERAAIAHSVEARENGTYVIEREPRAWYDTFRPYRIFRTSEHTPNTVHVFTAVYAPHGIHETLTHVWQFYNPEENRWIERHQSSFTLRGGRYGGFRAFSNKDNAQPGLWRVEVRTPDGGIVGRINMRVTETKESPNTVFDTL